MKYALIAALLLFSTVFAYHSGSPQNSLSDQFGGKFKCPPHKCPGGFNTYTHIKPKVLSFLGCDPGGPPCQVGVNPFITAHVDILGDETEHVRFHVTSINGQYFLENYSITQECNNPVHIGLDYSLE